MAASDTWDNLPDINPLEDEGITIEEIVAEMVQSYEEKYEEITGEERILDMQRQEKRQQPRLYDLHYRNRWNRM